MLVGGCGGGGLDEIGTLIIVLVNVVRRRGGIANVGRSSTGGGGGGFSAAKKLQIANQINMNEICMLKQGVTLYNFHHNFAQNYVPYSRKYWRELNLAVEPKIAIARILLNLIWQL